MSAVAPLLTAGSGFLLAVLWMDLMFDLQVLGHRVRSSRAGAGVHRGLLPSRDDHLAPDGPADRSGHGDCVGRVGISGSQGHDPGWLLLASAGLAGIPVGLAWVHTVPCAVRLGNRVDDAAQQSRLARAICRDHLLGTGCMAAFVILWVTYALAS